jgi:pyruvate ferredoxin oxidoreductase delta subunit
LSMSSMPINPLSRATQGAGGPTGSWRSHKPVVDLEKCTGCLLCWIWCPEGVISKEDRTIDYNYCKGCGLCAKECPVQAITMTREAKHD